MYFSNSDPPKRKRKKKAKTTVFISRSGREYGFQPVLENVNKAGFPQNKAEDDLEDEVLADDADDIPRFSKAKRSCPNNETSWKNRADLKYPIQIQLLMGEMIKEGNTFNYSRLRVLIL
jgi:hypothetical protein